MLTIAAVVALLIVVINDGVAIIYLEQQSQQLKESDTNLAQDAQVGDDNLQATLMEQIQTLHRNFTTELGAMKRKLSDTEERHVEAFETLQEALDTAEYKLQNASDAISLLEENHSEALMKIDRDLTATNKKLVSATERIEVLETNLTAATEIIASLNATKASLVVVSELQDTLALLNREKASLIQFDALSTNLTVLEKATKLADKELELQLDNLSNSALNQTHHDQLQDFIAMFAATKTNQSEFEKLVSRVAMVQNRTELLAQTFDLTTEELHADIEDLSTVLQNSTLDFADNIGTISDQVALLNSTLVGRGEFKSLSANFTSLRANTYRILTELRYDIDDLEDGTVNRTHHDELRDIVNMFADTKANLSDLVALERAVSKLSWDINGSISELTRNITSLDRAVQTISGDLATTPQVQDLTTLTARVESLDSKFGTLESTVDGLNTSKAKQTDLEKLQNSVDEKLTGHISSAQEEHDQLESDISDNENQIRVNTGEISGVENSISQLQQVSASSLSLVYSWVTLVVSVTLALLGIIFTS